MPTPTYIHHQLCEEKTMGTSIDTSAAAVVLVLNPRVPSSRADRHNSGRTYHRPAPRGTATNGQVHQVCKQLLRMQQLNMVARHGPAASNGWAAPSRDGGATVAASRRRCVAPAAPGVERVPVAQHLLPSTETGTEVSLCDTLVLPLTYS